MDCEELEEVRLGQLATLLSSKKLDQNAQMCIKLLPFTNSTSKASHVESLSNYRPLALAQKSLLSQGSITHVRPHI